MAGADLLLDLPYQGDEAADIRQYRFVKLTGDQTVAENTAANVQALGVAQAAATTAEQGLGNSGGKAIAVRVLGVSWVVAGAAVTRGDSVMSDTQGRAVTAATAGNFPVGRALKGAAAAGDLIPVLLTPGTPAL